MKKKTILFICVVLLLFVLFTPACLGQGSIKNQEDVSQAVTDISGDVSEIGNTFDEILNEDLG